jgi:hypothetical protein
LLFFTLLSRSIVGSQCMDSLTTVVLICTRPNMHWIKTFHFNIRLSETCFLFILQQNPKNDHCKNHLVHALFFLIQSFTIALVVPEMYGYYVFFQYEIDLWVLNNSIVWFHWHQWSYGEKDDFSSTYCHFKLSHLHSSILTTLAYTVYILTRSARAYSLYSDFFQRYRLMNTNLFDRILKESSQLLFGK